MTPYDIDKTIVTPEEAIKISRFMDIESCYYTLRDFADQVTELIPYRENMGAHAIRYCEIVAAIWTAGRVQGIREERKRRATADG